MQGDDPVATFGQHLKGVDEKKQICSVSATLICGFKNVGNRNGSGLLPCFLLLSSQKARGIMF